MNTELQYLDAVAVSLAERERTFGSLSPDGPSSAEVSLAGTMLADLLSGAIPSNHSELWKVVEALAGVSDKWVDPEADPLGVAPHAYLENMIHELGGHLKNESLSDQASNLQNWFDLRLLRQVARRSVHRDQQKPPHLRWISNLRVMIGTTVGSLMYKSGRLLRSTGRRIR
jgi:hypothetical protein